MPSAFDAEFAAVATPDLFAHFGEQVWFMPHGSAGRSVSAIVDRDVSTFEPRSGHVLDLQRWVVKFLESEVAAVGRGDAVMVDDGPAASFESVRSSGGGIIECLFARPVILETRPQQADV